MTKSEQYAIRTAISHSFSSYDGIAAEDLYEWLLKNESEPTKSWPDGVHPCLAYEDLWVDDLARIVFKFKDEIENAIKWAIQEKDFEGLSGIESNAIENDRKLWLSHFSKTFVVGGFDALEIRKNEILDDGLMEESEHGETGLPSVVSVYGHLAKGGTKSVYDFFSLEEAVFFADSLKALNPCLKEVHNFAN